MKKFLYVIALCVLASTMVSGCRTTEENYRNAYEKALQKRNEGLSQDEITAIAREMSIPRSVYKGDSIPLRSAYLSYRSGGVDGKALEYNVAICSFKQEFNAKSALNRLIAGGYPNAVLFSDKDENLIVCATTDSTLDCAVEALKRVSGSSPVALRSPYPYILRKVR